ncbi:MAG: 50S ribosome-binding GTPase, partial [Bacteroidetes bacterium]|nr:50S ribosome-binding GTPase [Bacteroidota bacterium]
AAARMAMQHLRGAFSERINAMRNSLLDFCALLELELDFSEEDVEFASRSDLSKRIGQIEQQLQSLLQTYTMGRALKQGIPVAIVGKPNAGKSTLLNALLQEERALVSDIPGTTRDTVEDELVLEGVRFRFIDTAGIRDTEDPIEKLGIERSVEALRRSGMVLHLGDAQNQTEAELEQEELRWRKRLGLESKPILRIWNKMDVLEAGFKAGSGIPVSAKNGEGLEEIKQALLGQLTDMGYGNQDIMISQARHKGLLEEAVHGLERVRQHLDSGYSGDMLALDLRQAMHPLEELTGHIGTEEVLGHIFGRFCIGK